MGRLTFEKHTAASQHKGNLRNIRGTFAAEGMTISKSTRSNLDRIASGQTSYQQVLTELRVKYEEKICHMGRLISEKYAAWQAECEERFQQLKKNEEELNRIFIDIYGLQDELTPDVANKDVTAHRMFDSKDDVPESMKGSGYIRTMRDEIVSLISYRIKIIV